MRILKNQIMELAQRPRRLMKILNFPKTSPWVKYLYNWSRRFFNSLAGEESFGTISAKWLTGEATRANPTGALGQGVLQLSSLHLKLLNKQIVLFILSRERTK